MTEKVSVSPRRQWLRRLLGFAAALLILGLIGCAVLYRYLAVYEVSRPEITMDMLMETTEREEWLAMAEMNLDYEVTEFEDARALYRSFEDSAAAKGELSYSANKSASSRDRAVFTLRAGPAALCSVELIPGPHRYSFGRHDWVLGRVGTGDLTAQLKSAAVKVRCLAGEEFSLNGIPVSDDYLTREGVEIPGLSALEKRFTEVPCFVEYTVEPLYGDITVTDRDGAELSPTEESTAGTAVYNLNPAGDGKLIISAPEDVTVTVGGAKLTKADADSSDLGALADWTKETAGGEYNTSIYRFEGLYSEPEVSGRGPKGEELTPIRVGEDHYAFFYPSDKEGLEAMQTVAESYFENFMQYTFAPFEMTYYFNLLQRTAYNSPLYLYIAESQAAMKWAASSEPTYNYLHYDNYHKVSDDCFVCTVEYDVDLSADTWNSGEINYNQTNAFELVFIRRGTAWYAAEMLSIAAQ